MVHTLVRIPAGAALAAAVFGTDHATAAAVAALLGTLAATSHFAKATTRAAANTSPEPFSNVALSLAGDAAVPAALWLALAHPWAFLGALLVALALMGVLLWKLGGFLWQVLRRLIGGPGTRAATAP